ncbi:hypothetical protein MMC07_002591, partial [Pseudocyphellaria aurata]|nr:hypothetical protein [Pseudocyphellaria aurata]
MSTTKKIVLTKPADWDLWISFVRARATHSQIWTLIDPDVSPKPPSLTDPPLLQYIMPDDTDFDQLTINVYKARLEMYKIDLLKFEQQTKAIGDITAFIQETVATNIVSFLQTEDPHPWNYLRALKGRLAPSNGTRHIEIQTPQIPPPSAPEVQRVQGETAFTSFAVNSTAYSLNNCWILDNGTDTHMCNETMHSRFTQTHPAYPDDQLTAGTQSIPIKCFGTLAITIQMLNSDRHPGPDSVSSQCALVCHAEHGGAAELVRNGYTTVQNGRLDATCKKPHTPLSPAKY